MTCPWLWHLAAAWRLEAATTTGQFKPAAGYVGVFGFNVDEGIRYQHSEELADLWEQEADGS